jgi:spermidine/putrescine transport system permease protein
MIAGIIFGITMARKGISMEINAISTILFGVIVIGVIGYYAIQHLA